MMSDDDKIAEIRTRHEVGPRGHLPVVAYAVANADRGFLLAEIERLLDEESEKLRAALVLGSEVLASHQGSPQREWHSAGAWLYPGDSINVVRAPRPEIEVVP
jgi:hypothetical protein